MPAKGQFKSHPPEAAEFYAAGLTFDKIADLYGVSYPTARKWVLRSGVIPRTPTDYKVDPLERAWSRIDRRGPSECWEWQGAVNAAGYGIFNAPGCHLAHRYVLLRHLGLTQSDLHALHSCDNRRCCNPAHLRLGTNLENVQDRVERGRKSGPRPGRAHSKLTVEQVLEIRTALREGEMCTNLARKYGLWPTAISAIKLRKIWTYI